MKIIYTTEEAAQIIQDQQSSPSCIIEVEPKHVPQKDCMIHQMILEVRRFNFKGGEKIAAIMAIRQMAEKSGFNIPLVEAKNFVESL